MSKIHKLPKEVTNKIAAGEIIERPAYAVKELVENSIDANASFVKVEIEDSGLAKIAVYDDGYGMNKKDLLLSFRPHTTSKIQTAEDINTVKSLGFRGEALASIAAISDLTIKSKEKGSSSGTMVQILAGEKKTKSIGLPKGTQVIVERIFHSVPARKNFLKTKQTEYRNILDIMTNFALAYPQIAFSLSHNEITVFNFSKFDPIENRITTLLGETVYENLVPLKYQEGYINFHGFVSRPQTTHYNSQRMHTFINGRVVTDSILTSAVKDAYSNLIEQNAYPFVVLYIKVPNETVDINVHPRKDIVRFAEPRVVHQTVTTGIKESLDKNNLTFYNLSWKDKSTRTETARILRENILKDEIAQIGKVSAKAQPIQIHNLYLIVETKNGVMFIDQHAAHEAILYRKFKEAFVDEKKKAKRTKLKKSILLNFSLSDFNLLQGNIEWLRQIGFEIEEFGKNTFKVDSIPQVLSGIDLRDSLLEFIEDLREEKMPKDISKKTNKMLAYLSCRTAIKAGQHLKEDDIKKLIQSLKKEDYIYTCPHGRPVKLEFSLKFLDKLFKRH